MSKFDALLQDLNTYLKLQSNPVAVKMLRKGEKPPVPAKIPLKDFKKKMVLCQAWTIAKLQASAGSPSRAGTLPSAM